MSPLVICASAPSLSQTIGSRFDLLFSLFSLFRLCLISLHNCNSHLPSLEASEHAIYSVSIVGVATMSRVRDCQDIVPFEMNMWPS